MDFPGVLVLPLDYLGPVGGYVYVCRHGQTFEDQSAGAVYADFRGKSVLFAAFQAHKGRTNFDERSSRPCLLGILKAPHGFRVTSRHIHIRIHQMSGGSETADTVEARKLDFGCPPTPKPGEGTPA